jgi:hypothetical protein
MKVAFGPHDTSEWEHEDIDTTDLSGSAYEDAEGRSE